MRIFIEVKYFLLIDLTQKAYPICDAQLRRELLQTCLKGAIPRDDVLKIPPIAGQPGQRSYSELVAFFLRNAADGQYPYRLAPGQLLLGEFELVDPYAHGKNGYFLLVAAQVNHLVPGELCVCGECIEVGE